MTHGVFENSLVVLTSLAVLNTGQTLVLQTHTGLANTHWSCKHIQFFLSVYRFVFYQHGISSKGCCCICICCFCVPAADADVVPAAPTNAHVPAVSDDAVSTLIYMLRLLLCFITHVYL
jgi:hypothetical protein